MPAALAILDLDGMWLFNDKFVRAKARFAEVKAEEKKR